MQGLGSKYSTISQHAHYRAFTVSSTQLALSGLTLLDGQASETQYPENAGSCIFSDNGELTLTDHASATAAPSSSAQGFRDSPVLRI